MSGSRPSSERTSPIIARACLQISKFAYTNLRSVLPCIIKPLKKTNFPPDSYLPASDPIAGQFFSLFAKDGRGLDRLIVAAGEHATTNEHGIAVLQFLNKEAPVITKARHIQQLLINHLDHLVMHDSTGSFKFAFGNETIFNVHHRTKEYRHKRSQFMMALYAQTSLKTDIPIMQRIIDKHFEEIDQQEGQILQFEDLANSITLEMICQTKLGINTIASTTKHKISQLIADATVQMANPYDQVMSARLPGYETLSSNYYFYTYVTGSTLPTIIAAGHDLIREELIKPNEAHILATKNWLTTSGLTDVSVPSSFWQTLRKQQHKNDLYGQQSVHEITQFLVVGQETTAKLLMMSTLLLADDQHHAILAKARAEIAACESSPEGWSNDDCKIPPLPYLDAILDETLRLYPPIPDMIFSIKEPFEVEGMYFAKDSAAIISPRLTHLSKEIYGDDAHKFRPERFLEKRYSAHEFFPFGFKPRSCPGQLFSRQEVKLWLARTLQRYDLTCKVKHPFPYHQCFTMHLDLKDIAVTFTPRYFKLKCQS